MGGVCTKGQKVDAVDHETKNESSKPITNALNFNQDLGDKKTLIDYWVNATFQDKKISLVYDSFDKDAYLGYNIVQFVSCLTDFPPPEVTKDESLENVLTALNYANQTLHLRLSDVEVTALATLILAKDDTRTVEFYLSLFYSKKKYVQLKEYHRIKLPQVITEFSGNNINSSDSASLIDWSHLTKYTPTLIAQPTSWEQCESILLQNWNSIGNAKTFSSVKVLGSLHSCSEIWEGQFTIDLSQVPNDPLQWIDETTVLADANYILRNFEIDISAQKGLTLPATGGTDDQTLGGLISTNTAPATSTTLMYEGLQSITFITVSTSESGNQIEYVTVNSTDENFNSTVCSLGAFGIIRKVQFSLIKDIGFITTQKIAKLTDMLDDLDATTKLYPFWRIDWLPLVLTTTNYGLIWTAVPTTNYNPTGDYPVDGAETVLKYFYEYVDQGGDAGPLSTNLTKVVFSALALTYGTVTFTGPLRNMLPVDRKAPILVAMAEWGFDPADRFKVVDSITAYFAEAGWPNLPVEIELTKTDNYSMSAWNWKGLPYIIKFNFMYCTDSCKSQANLDKIKTHIDGMWKWFVDAKINFKAHWGKMNFMDPDFVSRNCDVGSFKKLVVPQFMNPYLKDRIQLE